MVSKLKIGLFGFGCVGQALYDIIERESLPLEIVKICVKDRNKPRSLPEDRFTYEPADIVDDPHIQLIVELIDDAEEAFKIVKAALTKGRKVITANKRMVAEYLEELVILQEEAGQLWYEAAVCGSIPIVKTIDQFYNNEPIQELSGIFNGSSNFILSKIEKEGLSYPVALDQAQKLGFAESDPLLDVGGYDTLNKLVILLSHTFGVTTTPSNLFNIGIQNLTVQDLEFARKRSLKIKLMAKAVKMDQDIYAYAMPCFLNDQHPLYSIDEEYNAVLIKGKYTDEHLFTGKGAGGHPTAASVIADIHASRSAMPYDYHKRQYSEDTSYSNDVMVSIYMRYNFPWQLEEFDFQKIWTEGRSDDSGFALGDISLRHLWSLQSYIEDQGITVIGTSMVHEMVQKENHLSEENLVY